jgi:mycothiol synthase
MTTHLADRAFVATALPTEPAGIAFRRFDPAVDYPTVAAFIRACHAHDEIDWYPTAEYLAHDWSHNASFDPATDAVLGFELERLVGLVNVDWRQRETKVVHGIELWVRPDARRRGIGAALLRWAEAHAREKVAAGAAGRLDAPHELMGWGDDHVPGNAELAARFGYVVRRRGFEMLRPLDDPVVPSPMPDGLEIRPVEPAHYRAIWDADTEAFRDHREPADRTEEDYVARFTSPDLDTSRWQVAWEGDEVAGSVMIWVSPTEIEQTGIRRAWLDHISVRRQWRKRGVATALITAALHVLREDGFEQAALGVDTENPTGALQLYERLGFVRNKTGLGYRKAL